MKLYDTAQKKYLDFTTGPTVRMYVCGITPYDSAHLGHIFTFMTYDLLQRRLEDTGYTVQMVRNITDVDEPIYVKARELGLEYMELANQEVDSFHHTLDALNFLPQFSEPRASEYIEQMIDAIQDLFTNGYAYYVDKDIYYDVKKDSTFGSLCGFNHLLQLAFMANRGGDPHRKGKHHPLDFLLWKAVTDPKDPAQWKSPMGMGRPGWHIECSVMSRSLLGVPFDLHGGGNDLIFPHHECEIAQGHGLGEKTIAHYWVHVAPLLLYGEKMSKSLGNLIFAKDLLKKHDAASIRLSLMFYHHRIGGEWQSELLEHAQHLVNDLRKKVPVSSKKAAETVLQEVRAALDDDLNTLEVIDALERFSDVHNERASDADTRLLISKTMYLLGLEGIV